MQGCNSKGDDPKGYNTQTNQRRPLSQEPIQSVHMTLNNLPDKELKPFFGNADFPDGSKKVSNGRRVQ